jgi:stage II sporulation protein D
MSLWAPALIAVMVASSPEQSVTAPQLIEVRLLSKHKPSSLRLSGPRAYRLAAKGEVLFVDGDSSPEPRSLGEGSWQVRGRDIDLRYEGALAVEARGGELILVVAMPLEKYVAAVTAGETPPDTPFEALRAQAIVARSYALASFRRHAEAQACDLAHCQVLRGAGTARHLERSRDAALDTEGFVLRLSDGSIATAPFHASCGGHTSDPVAVFGAPDRTGAEAVPDVCPASPWRAELPRRVLADAASELLGTPAKAIDLFLEREPSGAVVRIIDRTSSLSASGDAFTRALGARVGWGRVRSARFSLTFGGDKALLEGTGHGHGVGLCQAGAATLARQGLTAEQILQRYFPRATLSNPRSD